MSAVGIKETDTVNHRFTVKIVIGMLLGIGVGLLLKSAFVPETVRVFLSRDVFQTLGDLFIHLIKMLVVPIVLVSLVCGSSSLGDIKKFGRIGGKTFVLYISTTVVAIALAMIMATAFQVGTGLHIKVANQFAIGKAPSIRDVIVNLVPSNPVMALAEAHMLQIIVFAVLFGLALSAVGKPGEKVHQLFESLNAVLMKLIMMIMKTVPYGVFCLLASLFTRLGFSAILSLLGYFVTVLLVLLLQLFGTYSILLRALGRLSPWRFFKKMRAAMVFAFSVSSSNASIPVVLNTVEKKLGVKNSIASFIVPLGSTINMDGTAIMQGVATIFIAHAYHIPIGLSGYLVVIAMATLASIGTAGVPGVGLLTLAMVLQQVGLPVQGIALIIGVDRLLDMVRTAVNISGDSMIACLVGKSEKGFDEEIFNAN